MGRPREFDRDTALRRAIEVFGAHGFEGASMPMLLDAMKIGRQSLYDTFGDKRALYLECLERYSQDSFTSTISRLFSATSVTQALNNALHGFIDDAMADPARACLGTFAVFEFGTSQPDVNAIRADVSQRMLRAFESRVRDGMASGELRADMDPVAATRFLFLMLSGLKVAARAGANADALRPVVEVALRSVVME